jgi:hypothetical protein
MSRACETPTLRNAGAFAAAQTDRTIDLRDSRELTPNAITINKSTEKKNPLRRN